MSFDDPSVALRVTLLEIAVRTKGCNYHDDVLYAAQQYENFVLDANKAKMSSQTEQRLQELGLNAPRITPDMIDALMARTTAKIDQPANTTSTFVHVYLDGKFYLASGHSACVSPENFNPLIGIEIAKKDAEAKAKQKLWELEGYALYKELNK